jgi:hypothetical protein
MRALREEVENALLFFGEIGRAGGETIENARVLLFSVLDALLALLLRQVRGQLHHFIDDAQIVLIVQQPALGRDLGIDLAPERDVRLELGRTHERAFVRDGGQRREGSGKKDY